MLHFTAAFFAPFLCITILMIILLSKCLFFSKPWRKAVFLLDFACYKPPPSLVVTRKEILDRTRIYSNVKEETLDFMKKTLERSGIGDSTYLPKGFLSDPPDMSMDEARREAEMVIFGVVDELLVKTKVKCEDIGILVVNCTIFNTTPSLSSMIINRYKLRESIKSYNLSGMGCAAGLIAITLAKQLLQVHHNCYALVVSTENLTQNWYSGNHRSKVLVNCVFRVGGAAIFLSNRPSDRRTSKYELIHAVNTHMANSNRSYNCIFREEDEEGRVGVTATKDLLVAARKAIESNIISLGPCVLPVSEQIRYLINFIIRRHFNVFGITPYIPNFKKCFAYFLPHVGAKPVLDEVQKSLKLSEDDMEPSRMTLYRFGNTSSSSVWYELAYVEAKRKIKKGDRVWHMAFGSGFKCSSVVWRAIKTFEFEQERINPWSDEVGGLPVQAELNTNIVPFPYSFDEN